MDKKIKARVMDATKIRRVLVRIATEIIERNRNLKSLVIVGIKTRGIFVGKRIARLIQDLEGVDVPVDVLDITRYRDDLGAKPAKTPAKAAKADFSIDKKDVILVDDVLMTGRTIRAAMAGLIDMGRPKSVQLLV
ncbi:MAG: bifunctional pyr operon transcriptional regulator/uracil phosphoribosyltransferase PyrR, partial [Candidatus Aminicenantales bacterium]